MTRGGPGGQLPTGGAPRPFALAGIYQNTLQARPPIRWGSNRTPADNRSRTRRKGAAPAAPFRETESVRPIETQRSVEQPGHRGAVGGRRRPPPEGPDAPGGDGLDRREEDGQVEADRPVLHVEEVEPLVGLEGGAVAGLHLPEAGDPGADPLAGDELL